MFRYGASLEENCIRKIEAGIRGIKSGTKTPIEAKCGYFLNKLKPLNPPMYEELLAQYVQTKKDYDFKNNQ